MYYIGDLVVYKQNPKYKGHSLNYCRFFYWHITKYYLIGVVGHTFPFKRIEEIWNKYE